MMAELSYVHGAKNVPLVGEPIFHNLRRTASRFGDRDALVVPHQGYRATYRQLVEQSEEIGRGLMSRGVEKGDRVGIWSPNRHEWVLVQYATAAIGAILVNINPAYRTSELQYALNQSGISFLVLAATFRTADYRAMLAEVKSSCPALKEALVLEDGWEALKRDAAKTSIDDMREREATLQFDDPINIQYTSGTTGFPIKNALLRMLWWVRVAPYGKPVVPDVYWMLIGSSNCSVASRSRISSMLVLAASRLRASQPSSRTSASLSAGQLLLTSASIAR